MLLNLKDLYQLIMRPNNVQWEHRHFGDLNTMGISNYSINKFELIVKSFKNNIYRKYKSNFNNSASLKVLIVGNIAMYGLLKASVLQKIKCDCDVISFDFYHFAGSPEFHYMTGGRFNMSDLGDDPYFSNFWRIDEKLRQRPKWFAQGPMANCYSYLKLKRQNQKFLADIAWAGLEYNRLKCVVEKSYYPQGIYWSEETFKEKIKDLSLNEADLSNFNIARKAEDLLDCLRQVAARNSDSESVKTIAYPFERGFLDSYTPFDQKLKDLVEDGRATGWIFALGIEIYGSLRGTPPSKPEDMHEDDWQAYAHYSHYWKTLLDDYETAIFQAAYPIIGHAAGYKPYFGYEIGTIRHIPFIEDAMGRQVYTGYKNATGVFVTNSDYPLVEKKIEGLDSKTIFTPHAFDEDKVITFANEYRIRMKRPKIPFFLSPSRQWWYKRPKIDSKCNDLIIEATHILRERGHKNFKIEMVSWGPDIDYTKDLINKLKVNHFIEMVEPMSRQELWERSCMSLGVIDQFGIPGFGGVAFETMALATRLLTGTYADNDEVFFGSVPPILRAHDAQSLANIMEKCILDPYDFDGLGIKGQEWIVDWHSGQRSADIAKSAFRKYL